MPVIAYGDGGKRKYGYRDENGRLYWLDEPKEESLYAHPLTVKARTGTRGNPLIIAAQKLREKARK